MITYFCVGSKPVNYYDSETVTTQLVTLLLIALEVYAELQSPLYFTIAYF